MLEWFRRRNGPDSQVKLASIDSESQYQGIEVLTILGGVWSVQNDAQLRDLGVCLPVHHRCEDTVSSLSLKGNPGLLTLFVL